MSPWDFPGRNTGAGCHSLLQGIFLTQGSNPDLLHCRQILYYLRHQESPMKCVQLRELAWRILEEIGGKDFPGGLDGKESTYNPGDSSSIPGSGRSPGEGNGNLFQCSCLRIPWTEEPGRLQFLGSQRIKHN